MLLSSDQEYTIHHGDCIPHMSTMPAASVDFAVFSPPFPSLYAYTSRAEDIGNSEELDGEAKIHLSFFYRQLARILKPGRVAVVHVCQIPRMKRSGGDGLCDFRGLNIRLGERAGLTFQYDWLVHKNPQSQAIRTHSHNLLFVSLERDRAISRGALGDYLIKFTVPGENATPINSSGEISRQDWIDWAEASWHWHDIKETDTLNVAEGRGTDDTKHICPLQLGVIDRLVKLYSNPGEIVFSPFAGIGSEGFVSLKLGRRFYGCELKDEYHAAAIRNCERAIEARKESQATLFDTLPGTEDGRIFKPVEECTPEELARPSSVIVTGEQLAMAFDDWGPW
jgi:DNA modification methylase